MKTGKHLKGYILIEAIVSMMVLALGFLGIAKMQTSVVNASSEAKARAEAMTLAQARIDTLRIIARQSEHFSSGCTAGTILRNSITPAVTTGVNATFSETWTVARTCVPSPRHQVQVLVTWTDSRNGLQTVRLDSVIAWNDPSRNFTTLAGGSSGSGGGLGTPSNVRLGDEVKDYDSLPSGAITNGKDGSSTYYNSGTGEYELLVPVTGGYRAALYSNVPIVRVSGLVVLDGTTGYQVDLTRVRLSNISVYRTDITYCLFPLTFTDENDPKTYGSSNGTNSGVSSSTNDRAGAYVCYVPEGWAGNIGLLNYEAGTGGNPDNYACPEDAFENSIFEAARSHKVEIVDTSGNIVGQSGVLSGHETMVMPNYPTLTRLSRLDFLVIKKPNQFSGCGQRIGSTVGVISSGTIASGASYNLVLRQGAPLTRSSTTYTPGVPSIRYAGYVVDRYTKDASGTVNGGFVTLTGTYTPSTSTCSIRAQSTSASYLCTSTGGTYRCLVSYNWSGTIGYWNGTSVSGGASVSSVITNGTGPTVTCP